MRYLSIFVLARDIKKSLFEFQKGFFNMMEKFIF